MAHRAHAALSKLRRRRRSGSPTVKKSFTLHADVVDAADEAVTAGEAPNLSAFVEAAINEKLQRTRRDYLYGAYQDAARDRAFMADMHAVSAQLDATAGDGLLEG